MLNIKLKGKYKSEDDLIQGKILPEGAVQFKEGDTIQGAFLSGFLLGLPIFIVMIIITIIRCREIDFSLSMNVQTVITFVVMVIVMQVLTYVDEFIHALFYPKTAVKTVWKAPEQGAYFVYCDEPVSKIRFIILCTVPAVVLGVIPFYIWVVIADVIPMPFSLAFVFTTWVMTIMAIGDYTNIFNVIRQVPAGAKIFNYGMHSYWIE